MEQSLDIFKKYSSKDFGSLSLAGVIAMAAKSIFSFKSERPAQLPEHLHAAGWSGCRFVA